MIVNFPIYTFLRFCVVGGASFFVDAGILTFLTRALGWSPMTAQVLAFLITVMFAWYLNRSFTFRVNHKEDLFKEVQRYLSVYSVGFVINWIVYSSLVYLSSILEFLKLTHRSDLMALADLLYTYPALALVPATGLSMFFNFFGAKNFAFRPKLEKA